MASVLAIAQWVDGAQSDAQSTGGSDIDLRGIATAIGIRCREGVTANGQVADGASRCIVAPKIGVGCGSISDAAADLAGDLAIAQRVDWTQSEAQGTGRSDIDLCGIATAIGIRCREGVVTSI